MWGTTRYHNRSVSWVGVWRERELPAVKSQDKWTRPLGARTLQTGSSSSCDSSRSSAGASSGLGTSTRFVILRLVPSG
jgi:hypothetical protein